MGYGEQAKDTLTKYISSRPEISQFLWITNYSVQIVNTLALFNLMGITFCYTTKATSIYWLNIVAFVLFAVLCHNPWYHIYEGEDEKATQAFILGFAKYVFLLGGLFYAKP